VSIFTRFAQKFSDDIKVGWGEYGTQNANGKNPHSMDERAALIRKVERDWWLLRADKEEVGGHQCKSYGLTVLRATKLALHLGLIFRENIRARFSNGSRERPNEYRALTASYQAEFERAPHRAGL
jgi:hypothetical protein